MHSDLISPSGSSIWLYCAGSSHAQLHMPDLYSYPAEEGTAVHMMSEACFTLNCNADRFVGSEFNNIKITEEMAEHVQVYLDLCQSLPGKHHVELKLSAPAFSNLLFGTLDFAAIDDKSMTIVDLKYGRSNISVDANGQLWIYALMLLLLPENSGIETVTLGIYQPRVQGYPENEYKTVSAAQIKQWGEEVLKPAIKAAMNESSPRTSGKHCKHCKAKITCPEYLAWCKGIIEPPFTLTSETIHMVLKWEATFKNLIKQANQYGTEWLSRGITVSGCKLVEKSKHRKVRDERILASKLLDEGISQNLIFKQQMRTPAQLEKIKGVSKTELQEYFYKPPGEKTIALLEDNRPAVATSKELFNNAKI